MSRRMPAWVPKQHGAWAMLVVPYLAGLLVRVHDGAGVPAFAYPLFGFWLAGYFAFNAASTWLKAAPSKSKPSQPLRQSAGLASQTMRALGSMNRRISQAEASRSTHGRARVAQVRP